MDRTPVNSSNVHSVGWADNVLEVEYKNGAVYQYSRVPEGKFRDLMAADSVGKFLGAHIKGNKDYPCVQVPRDVEKTPEAVQFAAGMHIDSAAQLLVERANEIKGPTSGKFNDVELRANPGDEASAISQAYTAETKRRQEAWRASPEGIAFAERLAAAVTGLQATADRLTGSVEEMDFTDRKAVLEFLGNLQPASDLIGVTVDNARIGKAFAAAGLIPNMCTGSAYDPNDRDISWRWIVGQALDGLVNGPAIHSMFGPFAEKWIARWEPDR